MSQRCIASSSTLYKRKNLYEDASSFTQKSILVARNYDLWHKTSNPHQPQLAIDLNTSSSASPLKSQMVAFFAKIRHPPRLIRLMRFFYKNPFFPSSNPDFRNFYNRRFSPIPNS